MGTPVKVFRSTDTDAPQIIGGRGDFKTVLKACLAAGYGSGSNKKEPLGWEVVAGTESADGFDCAFRPTDLESGRHIIHVAGTTTSTATISAYMDTDAAGALIEKAPAIDVFPTFHSTGIEWILVGHAKAFIIIIGIKGAFSGKARANGAGLFFGDIENRVNNPRGNTILFRISNLGHFGNGGTTSKNIQFWNGDSSLISQSVNGLSNWVKVIPSALFTDNLLIGNSPINSEVIYSKIAVTAAGMLRGFLPFGYLIHQSLMPTEHFAEKSVDGKNYLICNLTRSGWATHYLAAPMFFMVNLTEWD